MGPDVGSPQQRILSAQPFAFTMSGMIRAFSRTRALRGPGRSDVDIAMSKWWTKKRPTEGQVTMTISQHEQHVIGPWLKTFPKKTLDRAPSYVIWLGGSLLLTYASIMNAQLQMEAEDYSHRP